MMRVWLNGFVMGNLTMVGLLMVIYLTQPSHMRELDEYPLDANRDAIATPPDSVELNSPPPERPTP